MSAAQDYLLRELAETLQYELELQGVPSCLHLGAFPAPSPGSVYILLDPREYARLEGKRALPSGSILRRTILLYADPPPTESDDDHLRLLKRAGAVFAVDQRSVLAMRRVDVPARLLRPGYSKSLDRFDPEAPRPIDVMFLGTHSLRRTRYLSRAATVLSRHNCLLQISDEVPSPGDTSSFLGPGRWPLLARTKVLININRTDDSRFEWRPALDAIHAGAVVVTEHASGIAPLEAGEHLLVASPDALPYVVETLLRDEQRLARIRAQAYERLSAWIPYALWVSVLRASVVELVGEPIGPESSPTEPLAVPANGVPPATTATVAQPEDPVGTPLPGTIAPSEVVHQSPAWRALAAARLTVLTALRGTGEELVTTLDSLAASRPRDVELVVVDAGSSDRTRAIAKDWMIAHPRVASRLVLPATARGVGAARNLGLDFGRAPYCLLLDPGQMLYPRCLDVLVGTLDAMPEMTFVYPIQEVIDAPDAFVDAGGDYLMSFFGWDPGRLRRGNYVHAPVLIRTDGLRRIGGFTADPRLAGLEEYDLWCRMAEQGWRGQLVPQELARRSESGSSDVLSAIRPAPGTGTNTLMSRAPSLMAGAFPRPDQP